MSDDEGSDNDVPSLSAALGQNSVGGASRPTTGASPPRFLIFFI